MASRRRVSNSSPAVGPLSVHLLGLRRVLDLHSGLAALLGSPASVDAVRLDAALACAYDASTLGSGDCRAQAALVLMGFRVHRPAGELDPPLAFLSVLALLDANGFALGDVPYAEVTAQLEALTELRPEQGGTEILHRWLVGWTKPTPASTAPLPRTELIRLVESTGMKVESAPGQLRVLRRTSARGGFSWLPGPFRRPSWEQLHTFTDPGEGLLGVAALRDLRRACGLEAEPFLDERAWREGTLRAHRHLWPRLLGVWKD